MEAIGQTAEKRMKQKRYLQDNGKIRRNTRKSKDQKWNSILKLDQQTLHNQELTWKSQLN